METNYKKTIYKEITEDEVDYKKITYKLEGLNNLPEEPGIYFMKDKEDIPYSPIEKITTM